MSSAYGRPKCAWCHKRHRAGVECPTRTRETKARVKTVFNSLVQAGRCAHGKPKDDTCELCMAEDFEREYVPRAAYDAAIDAAIEWVRLHVSGIAAPNHDDLRDMHEWILERSKRRPGTLR